MKFKKYFSRFLLKDRPEEEKSHHKRKIGFTWDNTTFRRFRFLYSKKSFIYLLIPLLFLLFAGVTFAQAPSIRLLAASFIKPKTITQSSTILSASVQSAIQNLASQEIKQQQTNANLVVGTINGSSTQISQSGLIQPLVTAVQEILTTNPIDKAKLRLTNIDRQIIELQTLLEKDKSDRAVSEAINLIKTIGQETGQVVADPKAQSDRGVLTSLIQQYNRLQLVIQKVEDQLPTSSYLKIEDVREKYLEKGAQDSLNSAPNLEVVNNIGIAEVTKIVGKDFAELKAIEILSDLESGLKPETKQKLGSLEKELATQFEKRMLKLPRDVRERKLQNYINYSYGNPLRQIQSFDRMKDFMSDREIILGLDSVKEITFKKLENRIFELNTREELNQFLEKVLTNPSDLKVLTQMKLDIDSGKDQTRKQKLAQMQTSVEARISQFFGKENLPKLGQYFAPQASKSADLLDIVLINNLNDIISKSPDLPADAKQAFKNVKTQQLALFVKNLSLKDFTTKSTAAYDPVSASADVRILLSSPQSIQLLQAVKNELPESDKSKIDIALRAQAAILQEHILLQVMDPAIFEQYQAFIANNPQVKQTIQSYVGQSFFTNLNQKKKLIDKQSKEEQQALYEKMQQIIQQIFIAPHGQEIEKQLPTEVQAEIHKLKQELPSNNVPKLDTPVGVTLPAVAKLPDDVNLAIVQVAKQKIKDKAESTLSKLDLTVQAKDLGVSEPTILPGNLLYPVIETLREIPVLLTSNPIDKAEKQLKIDNERTLEAAKLLEGSQSQETVSKALTTLDKINQDFDLLKAHVDDLKKEDPAKVDKLVDQIIENGLARQTVLSSIENKVYGDDYVKVETNRQAVLKNGVGVLLDLTNQDAQKLTNKLEAAVQSSQGSDLKNIKAVELLTEISRTQPAPVQQVLEKSEANLAQNLETKLLEMPKAQRTQEVLSYAENASGNPIRQFEAYDTLKKDFKNPETIILAEGLKDKAVENLTQKVSEITDASSRAKFVDAVIGDKPQDLKIAIEIEQRVTPPTNTLVTETLPTRSEALPIVEKVQDIKANIEQNIIDTYKDKPQELAKTDFYQSATTTTKVDITDIKVGQDIVDALARSPEVSQEVVNVAKQEEKKIVATFIEDVSKPEFQVAVTANVSTSNQPSSASSQTSQTPQSTSAITATTGSSNSAQTNISPLAAQILNPVPETLAELVNLKNIVPLNKLKLMLPSKPKLI